MHTLKTARCHIRKKTVEKAQKVAQLIPFEKGLSNSQQRQQIRPYAMKEYQWQKGGLQHI